MSNNPSVLDQDRKVKFDLLKEHYRGIAPLLIAMRAAGYIPDSTASRRIEDVVDELYAKAESSGAD